MRSCHRSQRRICSNRGKDISIIKNRERESSEVHKRSVNKEIHLTIKITIDITGVFCIEKV